VNNYLQKCTNIYTYTVIDVIDVTFSCKPSTLIRDMTVGLDKFI